MQCTCWVWNNYLFSSRKFSNAVSYLLGSQGNISIVIMLLRVFLNILQSSYLSLENRWCEVWWLYAVAHKTTTQPAGTVRPVSMHGSTQMTDWLHMLTAEQLPAIPLKVLPIPLLFPRHCNFTTSVKQPLLGKRDRFAQVLQLLINTCVLPWYAEAEIQCI